MDMATIEIPDSAERWNALGEGLLPGNLGIEVEAVEPDEVRLHLRLERRHLSPNGFLHAGTVVTLADTACGYGTVRNLPEGATGFGTIELKSNFLGTALEGDLACVAKPVHRGRTTQVWDAEVTSDATGRTLALFRCTQLVLYR
jgi:uncharacterized protein (TIGR00369 family)